MLRNLATDAMDSRTLIKRGKDETQPSRQRLG